jgi:hypothetical protein
MQTIASRTHCSYLRVNGIHMFRFERSSRRAIDEWLLHLDRVFANSRSDETVQISIEYAVRGMPHLSYATERLRQWINGQQRLPRTRIVFLHNNATMAMIIDGIARLLLSRRHTIRFFNIRHTEDAIDWLMKP